MISPDSQGPAADVVQYTSFASEIDLTQLFGGPSRAVMVVGAGSGTLAVETTGSGGATRTLTVTDGWYMALQVTRIKTTTDVATLQVFF